MEFARQGSASGGRRSPSIVLVMSFRTLPPEIHTLAFQFTDVEGLQNLCLVSKYLLELAAPLLYRVVYLPTRRRVQALSRTIGDKPELAQHVRHMLLSDRNTDVSHIILPDFIIHWPQTTEERIIRRQRIRDWLVERECELYAFRQALYHILFLTSRHIHTLTLLHFEHNISTLHELLDLPFPKLVELTVRGNYPPLLPSLNLPALERLHLAAGDMPNPWASFAAIASGCPRLTHMRVTEPLSCILSGVVLAHAFEVTLGYAQYDPRDLAMAREPVIGEATIEAVAAQPRLPPSLTCLLLQPYPPELGPMGFPYPDHQEMMQRLEALEQKSELFHLVVLTTDDYTLPYCFEAAQRHWQSRMEGGEGCWPSLPVR